MLCRVTTHLFLLFLLAAQASAQLSSKVQKDVEQDPEGAKAVIILTEALHWPRSEALSLIEQTKAYADDSPYSYPAVLKLAEQLATRGARSTEIVSQIKSCGDAVALINGNDSDLSDIVLMLFELRTDEDKAREEGYAALSALNSRGIPAFDLLARMTGMTSDSIKQRAQHNALNWKATFDILLDAFERAYGGLAHKIKDQRKQASATSSPSPDERVGSVQNMTSIKKADIEGGGTMFTISGPEPIALVMPPASALSSTEDFRDWTLPFLHKIVVANKLDVQMKSGTDSSGTNYLLFDSPSTEASRVRYVFYLPTGNDGSVFAIVSQKYNLNTGIRLVP